MNRTYYHNLTDQSIAGAELSRVAAEEILTSDQIELLPLLNAAYEVRKTFVGKSVTIHIINNTQNGYCPEDCHYCAQAKSAKSGIEEYPLKPDAEIMAEAQNAFERGAHRYCMVFAGRGPTRKRVDHLAQLIKDIKSKYPLEICVSAGLLNEEKAQILKDAGLDRLNHNLNTSSRHYPNICSSHTYDDRLQTLAAARKAGLQLCSGVIMGMGEETEDLLDVAYRLRDMKVESIPVNFLIPIPGTTLKNVTPLTPELCLRVLCLYRFLNPKCELRVAAGRELHLRDMEVLAFYPANSLFMDGYLNTKGAPRLKTLRMIQDAGFTLESSHPLEELIEREAEQSAGAHSPDPLSRQLLKDLNDLRPRLHTPSSCDSGSCACS